eukprot:565791-Hanusia_phi.AAC.2
MSELVPNTQEADLSKPVDEQTVASDAAGTGELFYRETVKYYIFKNSNDLQTKFHHHEWRTPFEFTCNNKGLFDIFCGNCLLVKDAIKARKLAMGLDSNNQPDMQHYKCFQGYKDNLCCAAGNFGDAGNEGCLYIEACLFPAGSIEASYAYIVNTRDLRADQTYVNTTKCIRGIGILKKIVSKIPGFGDAIGLGIDVVLVPIKRTVARGMLTQMISHAKKEQENYANVVIVHELSKRMETSIFSLHGKYKILKDEFCHTELPTQLSMDGPAPTSSI